MAYSKEKRERVQSKGVIKGWGTLLLHDYEETWQYWEASEIQLEVPAHQGAETKWTRLRNCPPEDSMSWNIRLRVEEKDLVRSSELMTI